MGEECWKVLVNLRGKNKSLENFRCRTGWIVELREDRIIWKKIRDSVIEITRQHRNFRIEWTRRKGDKFRDIDN